MTGIKISPMDEYTIRMQAEVWLRLLGESSQLGGMEEWNNGIMEEWRNGLME